MGNEIMGGEEGGPHATITGMSAQILSLCFHTHLHPSPPHLLFSFLRPRTYRLQPCPPSATTVETFTCRGCSAAPQEQDTARPGFSEVWWEQGRQDHELLLTLKRKDQGTRVSLEGFLFPQHAFKNMNQHSPRSRMSVCG